MTKLYLSECFVHSSLDALQIHGGYGYIAEYELERRSAIRSRAAFTQGLRDSAQHCCWMPRALTEGGG
jgi:alkylation response protein AidB-like acyl-CoA dehydrogenase